MTMRIIPVIGSGGFFDLSSPFDELMSPGDRYVCKAIRKLSEYFSNNEDPKKDIYDKYSIDSNIYDAHKEIDIEIACLQSEKGHWLFVPTSFILKYPDPNGIQYRTKALTVALPALPVGEDFSNVKASITNLVLDLLGTNCVIKEVNTSRIALVSDTEDKAYQLKRETAKTAALTDSAKYNVALEQLQDARTKIAELEAYILSKL